MSHARRSAYACAVCGNEADRMVSGRLFCDACATAPAAPEDVHQDPREPQGSRPLSAQAVPGPRPGPGPGVHQRDYAPGEEPELYDLIEDYRAGRLRPVEVQLGEMPRLAGRLMRAAAVDMALLMGLRLAVDEHQPLPYATSFAAKRLGLGGDKRRASRIIRSLVRAGVVAEVGRLPRLPNGPPDGTKLYAPPGARLEDGAVVIEDRPEVVGQASEPEVDLVDEPLVLGAEDAVRDPVTVAARDGAGAGEVHDGTVTGVPVGDEREAAIDRLVRWTEENGE